MPSHVTIFDLDQTLCEHVQDSDELLDRAFDRAGVERYCDVDDLAAVVDDVPSTETDVEFFRYCFELAAERTGADPTHAPALAEAHDDLIDHSQVAFLPGAERALAAAREAGPVALVTNGGRETQSTKLRSLGIADAFDATVFCDPTAGVPPKPDPEPFERALSALDVGPGDALMVGDSAASDVAGATALGMRTAWVPYDDHSGGDADPDHTLDSLADLPELL